MDGTRNDSVRMRTGVVESSIQRTYTSCVGVKTLAETGELILVRRVMNAEVSWKDSEGGRGMGEWMKL